MPITYVTYVIGSLALCAIPPLSGFFSKDTIIEAAELSRIPGAHYAYICVTLGAMMTALYTFRSLFMTFHGKPRMDQKTYDHVHESPWVVWLPLVILAVPSIILGWILYSPMVLEQPGLLKSAIMVLPQHNVLHEIASEIATPWQAVTEAPHSLSFWLTLLGIALAYVGYILLPRIPEVLAQRFNLMYKLLLNKYGFDAFNQLVFVDGSKGLGRFFYKAGDQAVIDGFVVNGSGKFVRWLALKGRHIQTGYLYHYTTVMVVGILTLLSWLILR